MGFYNLLWELWEELWNLRIIDNEKCKQILFHTFLGIINPVCYVSGGKYISTRIHPLILQPTGTGKGEMMTLLYELVKYIDTVVYFDENGKKKYLFESESGFRLNPVYRFKATEAGLVAKEDKENDTLKLGLLGESRLICFDEGRVLFSDQQYYDEIRLALNMAMNENGDGGGRVAKSLRGGDVDYISRATIIAGSVPFNEIIDIIDEGFLERCFLNIQEFSEKEVMEIGKRTLLLTQIDVPETKKIMMEIFDIIRLWLIGIKPIDRIIPEPLVIKFDEDAIGKLQEKFETYYNDEIREVFTDRKQMQVMGIFIRNMVDKAMKIATQKAVLDLKDKVGVEDYEYAIEVCKPHMESAIKLISMQPTTYTKSGLTHREDIVKSVVRQKPQGWPKTQLRDYLFKEYRKAGTWDMGANATLDILNNMIKKGTLEEKEVSTNEGRTKIIKLKE